MAEIPTLEMPEVAGPNNTETSSDTQKIPGKGRPSGPPKPQPKQQPKPKPQARKRKPEDKANEGIQNNSKEPTVNGPGTIAEANKEALADFELRRLGRDEEEKAGQENTGAPKMSMLPNTPKSSRNAVVAAAAAIAASEDVRPTGEAQGPVQQVPGVGMSTNGPPDDPDDSDDSDDPDVPKGRRLGG